MYENCLTEKETAPTAAGDTAAIDIGDAAGGTTSTTGITAGEDTTTVL